jgi:hypothetical protein
MKAENKATQEKSNSKWGCHNLHLHYKRLSNLPFLVSREYKNTLFYFKCEIKNKQPFENM